MAKEGGEESKPQCEAETGKCSKFPKGGVGYHGQ